MKTLYTKFFYSLLLGMILSTVHSVAAAKSSHGLTGQEIKSLIPLLKSHDSLGLTQFDDKGNPKSITLAIRIAAKRDTVFSLFKDPSNFYYISTLFKENTILDEHTNAMVWSWASRHKILSVTGTNNIALYPPRRVDVTIENSSIGNGSFTFQFYKDGDAHTIMIISGFLNVDSSEWLVKFLVGGNPSMKQAMNIAIGFVVLKGTKSLAERVEKKKKPAKHQTGGVGGGTPSLLSAEELAVLKPLLTKGQLFFCDSHKQGRLKQATVVELVDSPAEKVLSAAAVPKNYEKHIGAINNVHVLSRDANKTAFSWNIGLSIFGLDSTNEIRPIEEGLLLHSTQGDLQGAMWRWQVISVSDRRSIVAYHSFADIASTSAVLKSTVRREPYLEHGLVLGSNIVMLKALKKVLQTSVVPASSSKEAQ